MKLDLSIRGLIKTQIPRECGICYSQGACLAQGYKNTILVIKNPTFYAGLCCAPCRDRTCDLGLKSPYVIWSRFIRSITHRIEEIFFSIYKSFQRWGRSTISPSGNFAILRLRSASDQNDNPSKPLRLSISCAFFFFLFTFFF
jgi:hypothetical protein